MNQSDIYHFMNQTAYEAWIYDQLNPDEHMNVHYPPRRKSTWAEKMEMNIEERKVDPQEQERQEDEWLKKHGVI
jgi:hypothetical protein